MSETRKEIVAKIEAKKVAAGKVKGKGKNLKTQRQTYADALDAHYEKIEKLQALIAKIDDNTTGYQDEASLRYSEVEHMEEILDRHDKAVEGIEKASQIMLARIKAVPDWYPGDPEEKKGGYKRDPEYVESQKRKEYLEGVIAACLPDIQRVFYARGTVSGYNVKGRKDV